MRVSPLAVHGLFCISKCASRVYDSYMMASWQMNRHDCAETACQLNYGPKNYTWTYNDFLQMTRLQADGFMDSKDRFRLQLSISVQVELQLVHTAVSCLLWLQDYV